VSKIPLAYNFYDMTPHANTLTAVFKALLSWRDRLIRYIETIDQRPKTLPEDKAMLYAAVAILGLLLGASILVTVIVLNYK